MIQCVAGAWDAVCSRCLASLPDRYATREEVVTALHVASWELCDDGQTFCLDCSRSARDVPFRPTARGVPRRRR